MIGIFLSISDCCIWLIYTYVWLNTCVWLITDKCGKTISGELTLSTLQGAGYNFRMEEVKKSAFVCNHKLLFFFSGTGELFNATFYKRAQDHFRATNSGAGLAEWTYYLFIFFNLFQINLLEHHLHQNWEWYWIQKEGWLNFVFSVSCRQRRSSVVQVTKKDGRNTQNKKRISQKVFWP